MSSVNSPPVALLSGATGFVGSHLARRLDLDGWGVHIITRKTSSLQPIHSILDRLILHTHDGTTEGMMAIMEKARPDVVFHLASNFLESHTPQDLVPLLESNVIFGTQLVEAMVENGMYSLVNTGTSWQHYKNKDYSPVCLYAATKQAFEALLQYYVEATPLQVITLKLFDTYGPGDPRQKLFSSLNEAASKNEPIAMSPGEQLIDLVYIDDVVEAYIIAAARLQNKSVLAHESYAVSSGRPISLTELVRLFTTETRTALTIQWGGRPYRPREVMVPWSSGECLPGWNAKVSLKEGLRRIANLAD